MTTAAESQAARRGGGTGTKLELTVVMPCLNKAFTVGACVSKAQGAMDRR